MQTRAKDAWWLAHLLGHAMITPSFIPPRPQRELRDLTRRRRKLIQNAGAEKNRVGKALEDANVKLGNVLSDVFGVSRQHAGKSAEGESGTGRDRAVRPRQRQEKIPQIVAALEQHQKNEHQWRMILFSLEHLAFWKGR